MHPTRRTFSAGLGAGLLFGPPAWTGAHSAPRNESSARLAKIAQDFYLGKLALFPISATEDTGDPAYEALVEIEFAPSHLQRQRRFCEQTLAKLRGVDRARLDAQEQLSHDLLAYECRDWLEQLAFPSHLIPFNHMGALPVQLSGWATGRSSQPLKTSANYEHFLARLKRLPAWVDQAIVNLREGMAQGIVLPKVLVERILPQLDALAPADARSSPYLVATREFPPRIPPADQQRLRAAYERAISKDVAPALRRLRTFMAERYLPAAGNFSGIGALPNGSAWYRTLVRSNTSTAASPAQIHELGLKEVARIRGEIEEIKERFGFSGGLGEFFKALDERPDLRPFRTEAEVLAAYAALNARVKPLLPELFERAPRAALEIRAIDPIRRATASPYYAPPAMDGSRPGVFYVLITDPTQYMTTGMTALFLHEGQPGHHYQIALQQELDVPKFRKVAGYNAYAEGWGLYAESLGRELGLYEDPNAYLGRLFGELHRALRLVVDTGLHDQGWTRDQTIAYLHEQEGASENGARRATERYMAWPGQALGYKVGELKILELRERARSRLGSRFDLRAFHTQVLGAGAMPLAMLESRIDAWIASPA